MLSEVPKFKADQSHSSSEWRAEGCEGEASHRANASTFALSLFDEILAPNGGEPLAVDVPGYVQRSRELVPLLLKGLGYTWVMSIRSPPGARRRAKLKFEMQRLGANLPDE